MEWILRVNANKLGNTMTTMDTRSDTSITSLFCFTTFLTPSNLWQDRFSFQQREAIIHCVSSITEAFRVRRENREQVIQPCFCVCVCFHVRFQENTCQQLVREAQHSISQYRRLNLLWHQHPPLPNLQALPADRIRTFPHLHFTSYLITTIYHTRCQLLQSIIHDRSEYWSGEIC